MEKLIINPTIKTPKVHFDNVQGRLELVGKSIPENSLDLYTPIVDWVKEYVEEAAPITTFIFKLSYFNSSSTEYILDIMKRLDALNKTSKEVMIKWYFSEEDEDMEQVGEDFKMMLSLPIEMVQVSEDEMEKATTLL